MKKSMFPPSDSVTIIGHITQLDSSGESHEKEKIQFSGVYRFDRSLVFCRRERIRDRFVHHSTWPDCPLDELEAMGLHKGAMGRSPHDIRLHFPDLCGDPHLLQLETYLELFEKEGQSRA